MTLDYSGEQGDAYHKERHKEIFENSNLISAWSEFAAHIYLPGTDENTEILEIGAGTGINVAFLAKKGKVSAVEPSPFARQHCNSLGITAVSSLEELPAGKQFDRILLRHVLEHVDDPGLMLEKIQPYLGMEGIFVIVLPIENPLADVDPEDKDFHLFTWNRQTIRNLLVSKNYTVKSAVISHHNGRRLFIPVFRIFGVRAYAAALRLLGKVTGAAEIIITCQRTA